LAGGLVEKGLSEEFRPTALGAAEFGMADVSATCRLVHSSDLHIGDPYQQLPPGAHLSTCICPVLAVANTATSVDADVILLAGDTFDNPRVPRDVVESVIRIIAASRFTWIVLPGNHDSWLPESSALRGTGRASNLRVISNPDGETVRVPQMGLGVWGRALKSHDAHSRPMSGMPQRPEWAQRYVVVAHGEFVGNGEVPKAGGYPPSAPISDREVAASSADYVALGHRHVAEDVVAGGARCRYSGAPMSLRGDYKQVAVATFGAPSSVEVEVVAVTPRRGGCHGATGLVELNWLAD
jgi:DNA repair exonuclease SbcCD nuclease subunit